MYECVSLSRRSDLYQIVAVTGWLLTTIYLCTLLTSPAVLTSSSDTVPESRVSLLDKCAQNWNRGARQMSICVGTRVPACPLAGTGPFIPSATGLDAAPHSGEHRQEDGVRQFPSCSQDPHPMCASEPMPSHLPLDPPLTQGECDTGCGGVGNSSRGRERERARGCPPLLEDDCASLAAQAGGIKEDRDQSPSAPSLRGPRPQLQVHVLANHMFSLSPTTPSTQLANKQVRKP